MNGLIELFAYNILGMAFVMFIAALVVLFLNWVDV